MLNEKLERVLQFDGSKPIEMMTKDERDEDYLQSTGMTFDEFNEYYKNDTPELLRDEIRAFMAVKNRFV